MKHRVTNFGTECLEVFPWPPNTPSVAIPPGGQWEGAIDRISHGPGRTHYSVRPAGRQAGFAAFGADEED